jgi:hypothetical protein
MPPHNIIFTLNDKEKLVIYLDQPLEKLPCYCQIPIIFYENNNKYLLSLDYLPSDIEALNQHLKKTINQQAYLHPSINQDIGYLYNDYLKHELAKKWKKSPSLFYESDKNYKFWIGTNYQLWGYQYLATWMYNDINGNIIFEITPKYPDFLTEGNNPPPMPYKQWIKHYQSILIRTIPKETALKWLEQTDVILKLLQNIFCQSNDNNENLIHEECPKRNISID